jgi:predicted Zn-dependent protease
MQAALRLKDHQFAWLTVAISGRKKPIETEVIPVKGGQTVRELIDGQTGVTVKTPRLFVLFPTSTQKGSGQFRPREVAVKIRN